MSKKTYIDDKGYARFKDSGKLVHRWVASKKVGGQLYPGRVVHHRDGNKRNNSPSNLQVMSRRDHSSLHARERDEHSSGNGCGFVGMMLSLFGF